MARAGKTTKKQKKAKARERAKRHQTVARRQATGGALAAQLRRVAGWPLLECRVSEGWQDEHNLAHVLVARSAGPSIGLAFFLVDLQCLGVKDCFVKLELDRGEYADFVHQFAGMAPLVPCSPGLAAAIVRAGVDYAAGLGFEPHADFGLVKALLEGLGPATEGETVVCGGEDGNPLYIAGPYDNAGRVVAQLRRRLGEGGFHFLAPPRAGDPTGLGVRDWAERPLSDRDAPAIADLDIDLSVPPPADLARTLAFCGALKRALVGYAGSVELTGERRAYREQRAETVEPGGDGIDALDDFIQNHRLPDGRGVIEAFAELLPAEARPALLAWKESVLGVFRIEGREASRLDLHNLIDDLDYPVYSSAGPANPLRDAHTGGFLLARLVPFEHGWLFSGKQRLFAADNVAQAWQVAAMLARDSPSLVLRNPVLLQRSWEMQRDEGESFEECFGSHELLIPGSQVAAHLARLTEQHRGRMARLHGRAAPPPLPGAEHVAPTLPDNLRRARSVGLIHDPFWGLGMYIDYDLLLEVLADPELLAQPEHADVLRTYLESESIDPLPMLLACGRDPDNASKAIGRLIGQPAFRWEVDGEALLRRYKAASYENRRPFVIAFHDRLAEAVASL